MQKKKELIIINMQAQAQLVVVHYLLLLFNRFTVICLLYGICYTFLYDTLFIFSLNSDMILCKLNAIMCSFIFIHWRETRNQYQEIEFFFNKMFSPKKKVSFLITLHFLLLLRHFFFHIVFLWNKLFDFLLFF
jgi:hypothetical protein